MIENKKKTSLYKKKVKAGVMVMKHPYNMNWEPKE